MTKPANDRRLTLVHNKLEFVLVLGLAVVAAGMLIVAEHPYSSRESLIQDLSDRPIDGQRFFRDKSETFDDASYQKALGDAEQYVLFNQSSESVARITALVNAGSGRLPDAAALLAKLSKQDPSNPELLNDLGVIYWGLGADRPSYRFKALTLFERSSALAPSAAIPKLNLTTAYAALGLQDLAASAKRDYLRLQGLHQFRAAKPAADVDEKSTAIDLLRKALKVNNSAEAENLLKRHTDVFRAMALESGLNPKDSPNEVEEFIMNYYLSHGDVTLRAILSPLATDNRSQILKARALVQLGLVAYFHSDPKESLRLYDLADKGAGNTSVFDTLWIQIKRADSRLRDNVGKQISAAEIVKLIDPVIEQSRKLHFDWLLGQALVSKGNAMMSVSTQDEILPVLNEGVQLLASSGASKDTARPLYYLAHIHALAGDVESSLSFAYRSLGVTDPNDHVRLTQLYWVLGSQVDRLRFRQYAAPLAQQALNNAVLSSNPLLVAGMIPLFALTHTKESDAHLAEQYLSEAMKARELIQNEGERASVDRAINLFCGRISIQAGNFTRAEECLRRNLDVLKLEPTAAPYVYPETLLTFSELSSARGQIETAREQLRLATQIIEQNDQYFATAALRMPFEGQRRTIYDTAIGFEYDYGDRDAAWGYMQHYRAKLFLELLQQMNPSVPRVLDQAFDRNTVQHLIPDTVQVVEYTMLNDRLLIWLVSRDQFESRAVEIRREDLEQKVTEFLTRINDKDDVRASSADLYDSLIAPIAAALDPHRAVAIIPDLTLHRLNFAALYSRAAKEYLIQQYVLVESPSLSALLAAGSGVPARFPMVKFGARTDSVGLTSELRSLDPFYPGAKEFNRSAAVKPAFLSSLGEALVFQYSGHSQDAADSLQSAILLDGQREGPNSVTAVDISRTRMRPNSVVILASCDSSVGNSRDGIGMRGLTSAFLISGAGSVVGSLWLVESESTSKLVVDFHRNFAEDKMPVAVSLRNAQLALIKEGKHPYEWSGFVVTGNLSALR